MHNSVLGQHLSTLELEVKDKKLILELQEKDKLLQQLHQKAQQDIDFGPEVVKCYVEFKALRAQLIEQLKREKIAIPWSLKLTIQELEKVWSAFSWIGFDWINSRYLTSVCRRRSTQRRRRISHTPRLSR